jgi:glutamine---fructose-6-phosphate transaminase (isomerizing)
MIRCSKCLLPSSLPGSDFDERGECIWCQTNYPVFQPKGQEKLKAIFDSYRNGSNPKCLVGVSGGKDSAYVLMKIKNEFGLTAEAFTYKHSGATDFSLQNAALVCENLKVKHHFVALPDQVHLKIFQSFFRVWLKKPGLIPAAMTCVACKHMHILANKLAKARGIPLVIWANCPIEDSPFLAINLKSNNPDQQFAREGLLAGAIRLSKTLIKTPGFAGAFMRHFPQCTQGCLALTPAAKYLKLRFPKQQQIFYFDFCDWNPGTIKQELIQNTGWRAPTDVADDWHSDCTFHIIKEYLFQKMLGVSYIDGFLSNQIRRGLILREEALRKLLSSKKYFAKNIENALISSGLEKHLSKIDSACFNIDLPS